MVPPVEEICALCGETYPYYQTRRCSKCGRFYCGTCTALDENREVVCLNCFRRLVSPRRLKSKYGQLSVYLARRAKYGNYATLSFKRIEKIIGNDLPYSAYHYNHWWGNVRGRSPSEAWLTTGWAVQEIDLENQEVTFRRKESLESKHEDQNSSQKKRRRGLSASFKALAHKEHRIRRELSKTKIAKVQARSRNVQRRRDASRRSGKSKPKKPYEKRLYKPEQKPES